MQKQVAEQTGASIELQVLREAVLEGWRGHELRANIVGGVAETAAKVSVAMCELRCSSIALTYCRTLTPDLPRKELPASTAE